MTEIIIDHPEYNNPEDYTKCGLYITNHPHGAGKDRKVYELRVIDVHDLPDEAIKNFKEDYPDKYDEGIIFYPKSNSQYTKLEAAQKRAKLLRSCGVEVEIVEANLTWTPVKEEK